MRAVLAGLTTAVLAAALGGSATARDEKIDAQLLVGKWTPRDDSAGSDFVIEFAKDGTVVATPHGRGFWVEGTYRLDGNKPSMKMRFGREERTEVCTVHSLTKAELAYTGEGANGTYVRVRAGKK